MPKRSQPKAHRTGRSGFERLLRAANAVRVRAYAPYSGFRVGAAVLGDDGRIYAGCNVENSSYGLSICAERNAMASAVASGVRRVLRAAVVTPSNPASPPCGMCLQTFAEFSGPDLPILIANAEGAEQVFSLRELLPHTFDRTLLESSLERAKQKQATQKRT